MERLALLMAGRSSNAKKKWRNKKESSGNSSPFFFCKFFSCSVQNKIAKKRDSHFFHWKIIFKKEPCRNKMFSELQLHQIFERWIAILKWIINAITQYQPKKKNTEKKWNENPKSTTGSGYFFFTYNSLSKFLFKWFII